MKELKNLLIIILLVIAIASIWRYIEIMAPLWVATETQQSAIDLQAYAERVQWWTNTFKVFSVVGLLGLIGGCAVFIWSIYDKRQESKARAVNGTFALQQFKANGQVWVTDPNKTVFGVLGLNQKTGELVTDTNMIGPDRQLDYVKSIQKTRTAEAITGGQGIMKISAHAKQWLDGWKVPQTKLEEKIPDSLPILPNYTAITLLEAFTQSNSDWWVLGQNEIGACRFSIMDAQHVGILGATGTGKTASTATLMMLCALKSSFHVICLDGKGGMDWMRYKSHIEVYPTDYALIGDQINEVYRQYQIRLKDLARVGASDIYELAKVSHQIKPIMVILEEFGSTMDMLKAESNSAHKTTEAQIKEIFRKGRATGIHLVLIDQLMNGWPGVMKANVKGLIAYKIGGQQGAAFNAYKLHELADRGQFWNNGNVYDAWYTKPETTKLLQKLPPTKIKMLTDSPYSAEDNTQACIDTQGGSVGPIVPPCVQVQNDTYTSVPVQNDTQPKLVGKPVSSTDTRMVHDVYHACNGDMQATCIALWGGRTPSRIAWVKAIVQRKGEILQ